MHDTPQNEPPGDDRRQYAPDDWQPVPPRPRRERRPSLIQRAPASMAIIAICIVVFFLYNVAPQDHGEKLLSLTFSPANGLLFPGIVTHMFAHGDAGHLLVNMIVLFFLGTIIEIRYRMGNYLLLYFASGLLAAFAQAMFAPGGFLLGASGALAGVMGAFVRHYPKERLYLYGILPMPAWLLLTGWMLFNIYGASSGSTANVAFIAHIGGFAAGLILSFLIEPPGRKPLGNPWPARRSK